MVSQLVIIIKPQSLQGACPLSGVQEKIRANEIKFMLAFLCFASYRSPFLLSVSALTLLCVSRCSGRGAGSGEPQPSPASAPRAEFGRLCVPGARGSGGRWLFFSSTSSSSAASFSSGLFSSFFFKRKAVEVKMFHPGGCVPVWKAWSSPQVC